MPAHPRSRNSPTSLPAAMLTLKILHLAFMAGIGLFSIVVVVLQMTGSSPAPAAPADPAATGSDMNLIFAVMLGAGALSLLPATVFILPAMRKKAGVAAADAASDQDPDAPKLAAIGLYTTALLLRAAMVEGLGLLGAVAALLTENLLFLIAPVAAIAIIGAYFPTKAKFERFYTEAIDAASKESFQ